MLLKNPKGMFLLERNFRDAFKEDAFLEKYLEEIFDNDLYIVGDISNGILRLKGFGTDPKASNHYSLMDKYIENSTVIGCPYYVLKRIRSNEEYEKLEKDKERSKTLEDGFVINPLVKENFDKESLNLQSSFKGKPNIQLDSEKFNSIPKGSLPSDLKDIKENNNVTKESKPVVEESYVSSSPDFDPSKKEIRGKGPNRNNNNQRNNNNNNNFNKNNNTNNNNNYNNHKNHKKKNKNFNKKNSE